MEVSARQLSIREISANLRFLIAERLKFVASSVEENKFVLEIGAGLMRSGEFLPDIEILQTDVEPRPWLHAAVTADALPFMAETFDAVMMIAVLHHLDYPLLALQEGLRVLRPGGCIFIFEPHASVALRFLLSVSRHEDIDFSVDPFGSAPCRTAGVDNWNGNNAIGDLLFSDHEKLLNALPGVAIIHHRFREFMIFANSGGSSTKFPYVPLGDRALRRIAAFDDWLCQRKPNVFALGQEIVLRKL